MAGITCNECNVEMGRFDDSIRKISGWSCHLCGWSFDDVRPVQLAAAAFVTTQADTPEGQKRAARIVAEAFPNVIEKDATK